MGEHLKTDEEDRWRRQMGQYIWRDRWRRDMENGEHWKYRVLEHGFSIPLSLIITAVKKSEPLKSPLGRRGFSP